MLGKKVAITVDQTCDLSEEYLERFKINSINSHVLLDGQDLKDGIDIDVDSMINIYREKKILPKTAAINIVEYAKLFEPLVEQGFEVVHINLSAALSNSYQNCCIAAKQFEGVYAIDSKNLSSGMAVLAVNAAELAKDGMTGEEIRERVTAIIPKVNTSFVLDTLEFMSAGGRCSSIAALGANLLRLKPSLNLNTEIGAIEVGKKYRGSLEKCIEQYIAEKLTGSGSLAGNRIFLTYTTISGEILERAKKAIKKSSDFEEIIISRASCTIASHCGSNTLGIIFEQK